MRKGYKLTTERRRTLYGQGHYGFGQEGNTESAFDRPFNAKYVQDQGEGKPGLSVTHQFSTDHCPKNGIGCETPYHRAIYRDRKGTPVAFTTYTKYTGEKSRVSLLYADRTRGITHALAVGHIANHLDKVGVNPSDSMSHHSQTFTSHGFDLKDSGRDARMKQYLEKRAARISKGYEMSEERRLTLAQRYRGFRYRSPDDPGGYDARAWTPSIRSHGPGRPGLSISHGFGDECERRGVRCDEAHKLVYRNHAGEPVAYAHVSRPHDEWNTHSGVPEVKAMASDRSRGVTHALAVGHIAHHLDNIGVEPDTSLSSHSQKLVAHGSEMKETGRDSKLKNYLARRAGRVPAQQRLFDKGYKASPESRLAARQQLGAGPAGVDNVDEFAHDELSRVPRGKPGLSIHRNKFAWGGGWNPPRFEHESRAHTIVYRDNRGYPVTSASIYGKEHHWGKPDRRVTSTMVSDRSRGALHAIGTAHVANAVERLHAGATKEMTHESQSMVAHSLDRPERTAKLRDYIARRAKRGN